METIITKSNLVKQMQEIRNQLSIDIMNLSLEEQKSYIKNEINEIKKKRKNNKNN